MFHAFVVSNLCFAYFASQTPGLCSAIPSAPIKFVVRLCCILLYSVIFLFCVLCLTNIGFVQCFSFGFRKVSYTLSLRVSRRVLPHKHRFCHCYPLGSRKVCCTLLFIFFLFSNFGFACFASQTSGLCSPFPSAPVKSVTRFCYALVRTLFCVFCLTDTGFVQCYSLGCRQVCCMFVFALRVLPHQHRACAVLFPSAPLKFTPFWFSLFYSVCFCYACFAQQAPVCAVIFPRLPSKLHALFFALYYSVLSLCSAFFPSLI